MVLEGHAEIMSPDNTNPEDLRMALRDVYRAASGTEHSNWEEYDQDMKEQRRSVVIVVLERVYGTRA